MNSTCLSILTIPQCALLQKATPNGFQLVAIQNPDSTSTPRSPAVQNIWKNIYYDVSTTQAFASQTSGTSEQPEPPHQPQSAYDFSMDDLYIDKEEEVLIDPERNNLDFEEELAADLISKSCKNFLELVQVQKGCRVARQKVRWFTLQVQLRFYSIFSYKPAQVSASSQVHKKLCKLAQKIYCHNFAAITEQLCINI